MLILYHRPGAGFVSRGALAALCVNDYIFREFQVARRPPPLPGARPAAHTPFVVRRMVTIKDVAREAKVSVATVSRVLNGRGPVSDETRRRIREVAGRMRYVPHSGARSLITSKTDTLGVLLPDLYGEFFSEVIRGMDDTAQKNGFHLLISRAYADRHGIETAMKAMRGRVDGVVAMSPDLDENSLLNLPSTIPVVLLCSVPQGNEIDSLTIQNCRGAREMVAHLIER